MSSGVDELREAIQRHDEWPDNQTKAAVIDAARRFVRMVDQRAEIIEQMRRVVSPSQQAMAEILGLDR